MTFVSFCLKIRVLFSPRLHNRFLKLKGRRLNGRQGDSIDTYWRFAKTLPFVRNGKNTQQWLLPKNSLISN